VPDTDPVPVAVFDPVPVFVLVIVENPELDPVTVCVPDLVEEGV
jgi:hypothetical protein